MMVKIQDGLLKVVEGCEKGQQMSSSARSMPEARSMPDANQLHIGEGVAIKGEITVPDMLVVCGVVEGDISVRNLMVGETGSIKGRISVGENAEICGKVFEKLDVKCLLVLRSGSRVDGTVSYGMLQIEQGASIAGGLSSTEYRPEQKPAKADSYPRQDQKFPKQELRFGNGARSSKQADLSAFDPVPLPAANPAGGAGGATSVTIPENLPFAE